MQLPLPPTPAMGAEPVTSVGDRSQPGFWLCHSRLRPSSALLCLLPSRPSPGQGSAALVPLPGQVSGWPAFLGDSPAPSQECLFLLIPHLKFLSVLGGEEGIRVFLLLWVTVGHEQTVRTKLSAEPPTIARTLASGTRLRRCL